MPVERSWYDRPAVEVARDLLGARLVHAAPPGRVGGRIVETEAYAGPEDLAAHSARGRTARNDVMFGEPGHAYVYLIYGLHHCVNVVSGPGTKPEAVLIRAIEVDEGVEIARARRAVRGGATPLDHRLGAGPGNVCAALGIDRRLNGADVTDPAGALTIEPGAPVREVVTRPRIGVAYAGGWAPLPWRFLVAGNRHVSRA